MENNNSKTIVIVIAVIAVLGIGGWALMSNGDDTKTADKPASQSQSSNSSDMQADQNIVGVASSDAQFSTLVAAVKAAGLVETLSGEGPFTVFAPTNAAFDKLPAGTVDSLLLPENIEQLKSILTYHVVSGKVMSGDLSDGQVVTTVQGATLTVGIADGEVTLTDAKGGVSKVAKADVAASNGVIHVIDTVVMPN